MLSPHAMSLIPLLVMLAVAAIIDLRERKIRNWLTVSVILCGLGESVLSSNGIHFEASVIGLFGGAGLPLILFVLGALGGGDVKLLAGVGAWLGAFVAVEVFCLTAILGMLMVLAQAAAQGRLGVLTRNSAVLAINLVHVSDVGLEHATATGKASRSIEKPLPYAVPVFVVVLTLWATGRI